MGYEWKLHFSSWIALQKHYKNLEALALDRDEPEEVVDLTGKNKNIALLPN